MFRMISMLSVLMLSTTALAADPPATSTPAPATTAPPASTPAAPVAAPPAFEALDANKDGSLDKAEIAKVAQLVADLATADGDKNGKLAKAEFDAWAAKQPKAAPAAAPATGATPPPAK